MTFRPDPKLLMACALVLSGCGENFLAGGYGSNLGPPSATMSTLVVEPTTGTPATDANVATLTLTIRNAEGDAMPHAPFSLSATNTAVPMRTLSAKTNEVGAFTYALSSWSAGRKFVSAHFGGLTLNANAAFAPISDGCTSASNFNGLPWVTGAFPASDAKVADMNKDGHLDVVISDATSDTLLVALGDGTGRFANPAATTFSASNAHRPAQLALCDFNNDGRPDALSVDSNNGSFAVALGTNTSLLLAPRSFAPSDPVPRPLGTAGIACVDFNNDGQLDIILSNRTTPQLNVILGPLPPPPASVYVGALTNVAVAPFGFTVADVTGDGNQDVVYPDTAGHVIVAPGNGNNTFGTTVTFNVGTGNVAVVVADFNKDGVQDMASANANSFSVLLGLGHGIFATATTVSVPGFQAQSMAVGDYNGDGYPDLISTGVPPPSIAIALNNKNGTFTTVRGLPSSLNAHNAVAADINEDGKLDVVTVVSLLTNGLGGVTPYLGNGDGTLQSYQRFSTNSGTPSRMAAADVTGDGVADLVVVGASPASVSVLKNNGSGVFTAGNLYTLSGVPGDVTVSDVNLDGLADIAVSLSNGAIEVLQNTGQGNYAVAGTYPVSGNNVSLAMGDFNADGLADFVTANGDATSISVVLAAMTGGYDAAKVYTLGVGVAVPSAVAVTDLDADGKLDVLVAMPNSGQVGVLLGIGDGTFADIALYSSTLHGTSQWAIASADINLDGVPDVCVTDSAGSLSTYLGSGTGTLLTNAGSTLTTPSPQAGSITVGDVSGDGIADVVVTLTFLHASAVRLGKGDGTFTTPSYYDAGTNSASVVMADFNRDGHADIAMLGDSAVSVHLFAGCP